MKAIVMDDFGPAEVLKIGDIAPPEPGPDDVLIAVRAAAVNRPDLIQREGRYPPPPGESAILGLECAGTVVAVGANVVGRGVGDHVFALLGGGGYAALAVAHAAHTLPIPDDLGFEEAAGIAETYLTAWQNVFENGRLGDGETVLLHGGGGGVVTAAVQLIRALRPDCRIAVTASEGKRERLLAQGIDLVIDYRLDDFVAKVHEFTERRGVDVILDHIGAAYLEKNLASLAINGRLLIIGIMQGSEATINLGRLMVRRQQITGSVLRARSKAEKAALIARFGEHVMPLFASGRIRPVIDRVLPLEQAAEAHRLMEAGGHFGKIVLSVGD